jgi:hypothetical protein
MFCIVELGAFDLIGKVFENRWIKEKRLNGPSPSQRRGLAPFWPGPPSQKLPSAHARERRADSDTMPRSAPRAQSLTSMSSLRTMPAR